MIYGITFVILYIIVAWIYFVNTCVITSLCDSHRIRFRIIILFSLLTKDGRKPLRQIACKMRPE